MGTTSEKLTYLNTTKTLIKEELNLGGANITNEPFREYKDKLEGIYKDFLANGTDTLWNNWEKVTGSGTEISLNNTIEAKMDFVYKGNTSQKTTTGKNLFNSIYYKNKEIYTETISISTGNLYCTKLYLKPNTTYTISEALNNWRLDGGWIFVVADTNNQIIRYLQNRPQDYQTNPTTFTTNSDGYIYIGHRYGFTGGATDRMLAFLDTVNIQIEEGNTATSFEEYTGGPSPNPDYPQDIQVVSGDNTIKVEGKNLLDICYTYDIGYSTTINGIKYTINEDKSISVKGTTGSSVSIFNINNNDGNAFADFINKQVILTGTPANASSSSSWCGFYTSSYSGEKADTGSGINITLNNTYTRFIIRVGVNETIDTTYYPMVRLASITNNTYVPYQTPQTYPISLGDIELCKIRTYQDTIVKDNGKWYLNKQIGKVVLDGSDDEGWEKIDMSVSTDYKEFFTTSYDNNIFWNLKDGYSNYFTNYGNVITPSKIITSPVFSIGVDTSTGTAKIRFAMQGTLASDVASWKTWLGNNNTLVYYILATPTYEEITDTTLISQLEAIKKSYNTQTNISQTNADKPFILDVVALGELEI